MKKKKILRMLTVCSATLLIIANQGCSGMSGGEGSEGAQLSASEEASQPYHPKDFREILIPSIMKFDREKSMYIKSKDFNGGILHFYGRAETNSLINYFENTMPRKGWTMSGTVKAEKSLLIFTRPNKTCMITIEDPDFSLNTEINLYVAEKKN